MIQRRSYGLVHFAILLSMCAGCIGTAQSQCAFDQDCPGGQVCGGGQCYAGSRETDGGVCPDLKPSFADINQHFFQVGCRVKDGNCHSAEAAANTSGLDLSGDPWSRLVGVDSQNLFGSCRCEGCVAMQGGTCPNGRLQLVKPGDSANSFLAIKLRESSTADEKLYGAGMPADHPGETCATAQAAIAQWIDSGAENN